jgi:flagellar motor switch protein FliM
LDTFHEAWKQIIELDPYLEGLEMNPQFMQIVSPNEIVAVISFSTKIGDTTGMINLCLPHVVLEPIMSKLSGQYWFSKQKKTRDEEERLRVEERVKAASLPIIAELGTATITVGEFLQLQVGDVIQLDHLVDNKLRIKVGDQLKFLGQPGTQKGRVAVQIDEVLEEGEEMNE